MGSNSAEEDYRKVAKGVEEGYTWVPLGCGDEAKAREQYLYRWKAQRGKQDRGRAGELTGNWSTRIIFPFYDVERVGNDSG